MLKTFTILGLTALLALRHASAIELTVVERSGVTRSAEPVTFGVPLPRGYSTSAGELVLLSGGSPVAAEFRPVNRWPDGGIRWLHVDFQTSLAAGGIRTIELVRGQPAEVDSRLSVLEGEESITVTTGALKAVVKRRGFNLIDYLELPGGKSLVNSHDRGLVALIGGVEYLSSNDQGTVLSVESLGPMRVVLRAEGSLASAGGDKLFDYICRLYFYNGSPVVQAAYTFEYREPEIEKAVELQELSIELPVSPGEGRSYRFGKSGGDIRGKLVRGEQAVLTVPSSGEYVFSGAAARGGSGNPKIEEPVRLGSVSVSGAGGSVAAGLRDFWQMHPSSLEILQGGSLLKIGMVPAGTSKPEIIHPGVARTHYIRFAFAPPAEADTMLSRVISCRQPLLAVAQPSWYCSGTAALARLTERGSKFYQAEYRPLVDSLEAELDTGLRNMWRFTDSREKSGVTVEGYGLLGWGDAMHHVWKAGIDDPYNISWNGHYYDLPHMSFTEFLRSGDYSWLDFALSRSWHMMDVQVTHFAPGSRFNGSNRYCPPREHVRIDNGEIYVSNTCNHHKTQGLFERYYLTGDERALEVALKALNYANSFGAYSNFNQPRGAAFQVLTLVEGYRHTGDSAYLLTARRTFDLWWDHFQTSEQKFTQGLFMVGFLLEAYIDLYEVDPDPRIVDFIASAVDWMRANRPDYYPTNVALAVGFLAEKKQDRELQLLQRRYLEHWNGSPGNQFKDFANSGRSLARALYYLSDNVSHTK